MAMSTTNKIKLTKRGAVKRTTTAAGKDKWVRVAPRIQLRAIGTRCRMALTLQKFGFVH